VARVVLESPGQVIYRSISELAENAGTSEPTVLRFWPCPGFRGYHDLKIQLAQELVPEVKNIHEDVTARDDPATLVRKGPERQRHRHRGHPGKPWIRSSRKGVRILARAERIEFHPASAARGGGAGRLSQSFPDRHSRAPGRTDPHMQVMSAALMSPAAWWSAISTPGRQGSWRPLEMPSSRPTTIAIVSHRKAPVATMADIALWLHTRETGFKPEPMFLPHRPPVGYRTCWRWAWLSGAGIRSQRPEDTQSPVGKRLLSQRGGRLCRSRFERTRRR